MAIAGYGRSEEHTSELQSLRHLVCRLLLEKKNSGPGWLRGAFCCVSRHSGGARDAAFARPRPEPSALHHASNPSFLALVMFWFFFLMMRPPPRSPLFPSTPPFR